LFLLSGIVFVSGCGLADYEKKMAQAEARLQRFEDESRVLDIPLSVPLRPAKKPGGKPTAFNLFLRPPKGINNTAENEKEPRNRLLFSYRPRGRTATGPFTLVELAIGDKETEFRAEVLGSFSGSGNTTSSVRALRPPGREPLTFETTEFDDGQHFYSVNFWKNQTNQVAIVYWVASAQKSQATTPIKMSLETFGFGIDAVKQRERASNPLEDVPTGPEKVRK
jgi:hypothetical protein